MDHVGKLKTCQSNEEEEPCSKRLKWEEKMNQVSSITGNGIFGTILYTV